MSRAQRFGFPGGMGSAGVTNAVVAARRGGLADIAHREDEEEQDEYLPEEVGFRFPFRISGPRFRDPGSGVKIPSTGIRNPVIRV